MASFILQISLLSLAVMGCLLAGLIAHRWFDEHLRDKRKDLRRSAVQAYLTRVEGQEESVAALTDHLPLAVRLEAVAHLMRLVRGEHREKLLALADEERLFEKAVKTARNGRAAQRSEAILTLEQFGSPQCIRALNELLANEPHMSIRLEAASALARLEALPSVRDIISLLSISSERPTRLHLALFSSIAASHPEQIRQLLEDEPSGAMRAMLIEALSNSGDLHDVAELERAANDPDAEVRAATMRAARHIGDPRCEPYVLRLLSDPVDFVRMQAAQTVAKLRFQNARPKLEELAQEGSIWVQIRARDALSLLEGRKA
ncbi:hypothetical protein MB02_12010 [Croceicoccus estronivorus]|uniref:HEAT repeat domain-containing protein n=1 Tax=Croceicoccus estronivorus TaxID=1172626 RepID=UPI00082A3FDA|nr:HEAT repeat domain-containing protein [Croceicoccus estronivorus]OCC23347.1 hypothetical protein MB02_12010 [Croceicoccus estronivorus]